MITKLECGNYGEDVLVARRLEDGHIVLERIDSSGATATWLLASSDTLCVTSKGFGDDRVYCIDTELVLLRSGGTTVQIAHFEFNTSWGGVTDLQVVELARSVAATSGCSVTVSPTQRA